MPIIGSTYVYICIYISIFISHLALTKNEITYDVRIAPVIFMGTLRKNPWKIGRRERGKIGMEGNQKIQMYSSMSSLTSEGLHLQVLIFHFY